ncbi:MAG: transporter substrate-binding domain-containing protein [Acidovorax sp.]|jgi:polar amino acid transport system substrate-binding protein|nr:transporter substrate-binding domain-containing protein [Acidovorax sp.]
MQKKTSSSWLLRFGHLGLATVNQARRRSSTAIATVLLAAGALSLPVVAHAQNQNQGKRFKVAADVGLVPFFMKDASGKMDGFSYELTSELAKRMGYDGLDVVDTPFSAIFAGLFASRYDMVAGPINITRERASQMLFTEPYMAGGLSFLTKKGGSIASLEDLKGKLIAVNNGSFSDRWLQENQAKYGYEIQRFNKNNDAVQAVAIGRAFANLSETPLARFIAKQTPTLIAAYDYTTDSNYGFVFRKDDSATRNQVENAIGCMKNDGSLAKLHLKWFGTEPNPGSSMTKIYPGYGTPGMPGYDPTEHVLRCGK